MRLLLLFLFMVLVGGQAVAGRIETASGGIFTSGSTWSGGNIPGAADTAVVKSGHAVQVFSGTVYVSAVLVEAGGTLQISSGNLYATDSVRNDGTLDVSNSGTLTVDGLAGKGITNTGDLYIGLQGILSLGNAAYCHTRFENTGTLTVNPTAKLEVYGIFAATGGSFTQTGGEIIVDGNSGMAATSVPETEPIIHINATTVNCTGGSITIVDPHHASMFPLVNEVEITGHNLNAFSGTHTFYIGDGLSTTPGPTNRGFNFGNGLGSDYAPINNLTVRSGNGTERQFRTSITPAGGTYIKGEVHVFNSSDFQHIWVHNPGCAIGGNIYVENGSHFTSSRNVTLGGVSGVYNISTNQALSAQPGGFRNDYIPSNVTAQFNALTICHADSSRADFFNVNSEVVIADSLTMVKGVLLASQQTGVFFIQLGLGVSHPGKLNYTSGHICVGKMSSFRRWITTAPINQSLNEGYFPVSIAYYDPGLTIYGAVGGNRNFPRDFYLSGQSTNGGLVGVGHATFFAPSDIPMPQWTTINGVQVNASSSGNTWHIMAPGIQGSFDIQARPDNVIVEQSIADLRLTSFPPQGTSQNGVGSLQYYTVSVTGLSGSDIDDDYYYLAGNNENLITRIPTKQSGLWMDTATWKYNLLPGVNGFGARVSPGHTVNLTTTPATFLNSLEILPAGVLNVNLDTAAYVDFYKGVSVAGTMNLNSGRVGMEPFSGSDTSLWIKTGGVFSLNYGRLMIGGNAPDQGAYLYNEGTFGIYAGQADIQGSLELAGNSNGYLRGGKIYINPYHSLAANTMKRPLFHLHSEGAITSVPGPGCDIYVINPSTAADTATVKIRRNATSGIDLRNLRFHFGEQPGYQYNTNVNGVAYNGFKIETKAGTANIPLGKLYVSGGAGAGRIVRTGDNALFAADSVIIAQGSNLFCIGTGVSTFSGHIRNEGGMVSSGPIILGGTSAFPARKPITISKGTNATFSNSFLFPTAEFNKIEVNVEGMSALIDFPAAIAEELKLSKGLLKFRHDLTLGISAAQPGALVVSSGKMLGGPSPINAADPYFRRWFNTSTISMGDAAGLFPFGMPSGDERFLYIAGTPTSAGILSVCPFRTHWPSGITPITDAGAQVDMSIQQYRFLPESAVFPSMQLKATAQKLVSNNYGNLRFVKIANSGINTTPGTHLSAGGSLSGAYATRTGIASTQLEPSDTYMLAIPSGNATFTARSVQSGDWNSPTTWDCNCTPNYITRAVVRGDDTVTVTALTDRVVNFVTVEGRGVLNINADSLMTMADINDSGTLHINGGTLVVNSFYDNVSMAVPGSYGQADPAATLQISAGKMKVNDYNPMHSELNTAVAFTFSKGLFRMSGGALDIIGSCSFGSAAKVDMTGGTINIDPNSPKSLHEIGIVGGLYLASDTNNSPKVFSGGDIYILNPAKQDEYSVYAVAAAPGNYINMSGTTIHLGKAGMHPDDMSWNNTQTLPVYNSMPTGFKVLTKQSSGLYPVWLGNMVLETDNGIATGRHVYNEQGFYSKGNVTVMPGSEWRLNIQGLSTFIGGDLVNNGTITANNAPVVFGGEGSTLITNAQGLSGNGRFRASTAAATPDPDEPKLFELIVNNNGTDGLSIQVPGLSTALLTMLSGDIHVVPGNVLTLGWHSIGAPGFLTLLGSGAITGKFRRPISTTTGIYDFPVGIGNTRRKVRLDFTSAPATAGNITASFVPSLPGTNGLPLTEGLINVNTTADAGYWQLEAGDGLSGGTYDITTEAKSFAGVNDYTKLVLLKRSNSASPWTLDGFHTTTTGTNANPVLKRTVLTGFSEFAVGGDIALNPLPVVLLNFIAKKQGSESLLEWKTQNERNTSRFVVEWSTDGRTFVQCGTVTASGTGNHTYDFTHRSPAAGKNCYRLKILNTDGSDQYSNIAIVVFSNGSGNEIGIYPNPAKDVLYIDAAGTEVTDLQLTDISGRVVQWSPGVLNTLSLNVSELPRGTYLLKYRSNGREGNRKIVLE